METNTIYDVDYFIKKFEIINSDDWGKGSLEDHCAFYHCGARRNQIWETQPEVIGLINVFSTTKEPDKIVDDGLNQVLIINDGWIDYEGDTPKERILNYLYQIRDKESIDGQTTYKECGEGLNEEDQLGE